MKNHQLTSRRGEAGFTLIELLVVVLIIGILSSIALPQYFKVVEKGRFAEATNFIDTVKSAQEAVLARCGAYFPTYSEGYSGQPCSSGASPNLTLPDTTDFDVTLPALKYFQNPQINVVGSAAGTMPQYTIVLTRGPDTSVYYGPYTVTATLPPLTQGTNPIVCSTQQSQADLCPAEYQ